MAKYIILVLCCFAPLYSDATIRSGFEPSLSTLQPGEHVSLTLYLDATAHPATVGSFTAKLSWDEKVLKFINYKLQNAKSTVVINDQNSANGELALSLVAPIGLDKSLRFCTLMFVAQNVAGQITSIDLEYTAMAAAKTFQDLLSQLATQNSTITITTNK